MAIFDKMLKSDQTLFKNAVALDYDFVPKLIPHRDIEQKRIAACISALFQERNARNVIVTGRPGIGKTVACKHIIDEIPEHTDDIFTVYVNCWKHTSSFKILLESCNQVGYKFTHNKKTDELFDSIAKIVNNKKSIVFVFDEIDKAEDYDFLYMILEGIYRKSVILITNHREWLSNLDERIKSRLTPDVVEFKPYNLSEVKDIISQRAESAFYPGVISKDILDAIAAKTFELSDVRQGLYLLKESAMIAEDESSKIIEDRHLKKAMEKLGQFTTKKTQDLEDDAKAILDLVRNNSGKKIGELYEIYSKENPGTYKTFQRKIKKLSDNKFISVKKTSGGKEGNTTIIDLASKKISDY